MVKSLQNCVESEEREYAAKGSFLSKLISKFIYKSYIFIN